MSELRGSVHNWPTTEQNCILFAFVALAQVFPELPFCMVAFISCAGDVAPMYYLLLYASL